jgi:hypothetical protein
MMAPLVINLVFDFALDSAAAVLERPLATDDPDQYYDDSDDEQNMNEPAHRV